MSITQKSFGRAFTSIYKFNEISGNLDVVTKDSLALQLDLIGEEYLETVDAFDKEDSVEILDGAIDCLVVVVGLLQKLQAAGYDVNGALDKVNENNLSKFIPADGSDQTQQEILKSKFHPVYNAKYRMIVFKDANGKVKKNPSFKPVDLTDCVPFSFVK